MWTRNPIGVIYLGLLAAGYGVSGELDVCLEQLGCLKGRLMPGIGQQEPFEGFMGIPFAQPPVGGLRFQNPEPASAWSGVLDASAARSPCLQKCYFIESWPIFGEEDCLYLNVYRPTQHDADPLPVMVYFHSGGFLCGSACPLASGPEYLMATGRVVLVTVSYRLGPFGFLSTGDAHMSGNFGLKDQRLALQWVQRHIAAFGGDPQLVTIFGHSAGGLSTHLHMISASSKGLFQRAMSLSGTVLLPTAMLREPLAQAQQLAESVGVPQAKSLDTQSLASALRAMDGKELLEAGQTFKRWNNVPVINYAVVIEQPDAADPFLTECPVAAHLAGRIQRVPWLLGSTSRAGEGALFLLHIYSNPQLMREFNENFLELYGLLLYLPKGQTAETVKEILEAYGVKDYQLNERTLKPLSEILGDILFAFPVYLAAASYAEYSEQPVSIYNFEYIGNVSYGTLFTSGLIHGELGASHMDDAIHTLRMPVMLPDFVQGSEHELVVQRMTRLMVEFAKTGLLPEELHMEACKSSDFGPNQMCNYFHMGQLNGVYHETVERAVNLPALELWKRIYL